MSINWTQIEMLTLLEETAEESILQEMISIYETQMPEITQQIEAAIKADEFIEASEFAHKLKSSAGNLGFSDVEARCLMIEREARKKSAINYLNVVDEIRFYSHEALEEVRRYLERQRTNAA
ncbi:MAG: Hpt domain-containing protein [Bdellovibrionaceae bacterium]|jgi:HPt (histidine-containing phosphotransfer) domain-containing protein|nr:Hpt domain-containing protein [Pseudobdellovibrionaceae bacterium]